MIIRKLLSLKTNFSKLDFVLSGLILMFFLVLICGVFITKEQQFSLLAESFLQGRLYITNPPANTGDLFFLNNKAFWPNPPLPAIILMPFVFLTKNLFGSLFLQGYLQFFFVLGVFYLVYKISLLQKYAKKDSFYLASTFVAGSAFIGVALIPWSWYFAHVIAVFLTFLSLLEFFEKRRYWVIGLIYGLILLTRFTATLGISFFVFYILFENKADIKDKLKKLGYLVVPVFFSLLIQLTYNHARYGTFSDLGYLYNNLTGLVGAARSYGMFSIVHIPGNLYSLLLGMPNTVKINSSSIILKFPFVSSNPWGMSIFVTSPYLLYLFIVKHFTKENVFMFAASALTFAVISLYFTLGWRQYGYRYSLDFLPFLYIIFVTSYRKINQLLSLKIKLLLVFSVFFNLYLVCTYILSLT